MANLTDKIAVVTGAAGGIGAVIAKALAAAGAAVVVNYAGSKEATGTQANFEFEEPLFTTPFTQSRSH